MIPRDLEILGILVGSNPRPVRRTELARRLKVSLSYLSPGLRKLREAGLVARVFSGGNAYYHLRLGLQEDRTETVVHIRRILSLPSDHERSIVLLLLILARPVSSMELAAILESEIPRMELYAVLRGLVGAGIVGVLRTTGLRRLKPGRSPYYFLQVGHCVGQ